MKILMYSVRDHEKPAIKKWLEANPGVQIDLCNEALSEDTVCKAKEYDGIAIQQTNSIGGKAVYSTLKEYGIKQIASRTAGVDMIDLKTASDSNILVTNVPAYSPNAIAELAVTHTMNLLRNIKTLNKRIAYGDYRWSADLIAREVRSVTVGVVGTGKIGRTSAKLFKGLGANVIGYDAYPDKKLEENNFLTYKESLEDLLKEADVVTLHTPLLESTKHMINKNNLKYMKPDAFIVNTGRGGIINTEDLIEALEQNKIAGAALDTFENEGLFLNKVVDPTKLPDPQLDKLLKMDQVLITHHVGFFTTTAVQNIVDTSLDSVVEVLKTNNSVNKVN
ncbi:lactate dehydrogenase [Clostridium botulinum A2 117]|uniref:D-2-hydroxyacid dehydrogenase n=1 Tax=Clostridium botulinum TaxID=1491 RepID=A0AA43Y8R7_CLOBO|nr:D-2-hydroxyacid dehydrogenase [Clostridium botulinum]KEI77231.1 lactate dehydrogenase [Clostridium botulinum A2 117]MBN3417310.1 lactate dehydrogenase [Clostridium botulinum]MBN3443722.1 lactate dehydrogenase [Clostridium botulinum]MBY6808236.1 D-2-hydroxyacid dehydrogenase [Clostridium botulinum]MCS4471311.1 D-2-hydroxyacid dehydrogenase [Clostridium botulinum]